MSRTPRLTASGYHDQFRDRYAEQSVTPRPHNGLTPRP